MDYITVEQLNRDIKNILLPQIPEDVDLIVGIPRDGMLIANLISLYRNIPFIDLNGFIQGRVYEPGRKIRKRKEYFGEIRAILLVDDTVFSGGSIREAKAQLRSFAPKIYTAVGYVLEPASKMVKSGLINFYAGEVKKKHFHYEWTQGDTPQMRGFFMDFDGILCPDCTKENDDDGERYRNFLINSPVKIKPINIGTLITWRHEKYRQLTEEWLAKHGIDFGKLIMAEREKWKNPVEFKAYHYGKSNAHLFLESSTKQAKQINKLTGKPVIGLETNEIFQ